MSVVFYLLAALTLAGGLAAVLLKNLVHCALAFTVAFAGSGAAVPRSTRSSPASRRFWFTSAPSPS